MGGLLSGVKGFAAFWAVLVCLPGYGGGSSLELLLVTCLLPLARGWVLGQVVTGSFFLPPFFPSILTLEKVLIKNLKRRLQQG